MRERGLENAHRRERTARPVAADGLRLADHGKDAVLVLEAVSSLADDRAVRAHGMSESGPCLIRLFRTIRFDRNLPAAAIEQADQPIQPVRIHRLQRYRRGARLHQRIVGILHENGIELCDLVVGARTTYLEHRI